MLPLRQVMGNKLLGAITFKLRMKVFCKQVHLGLEKDWIGANYKEFSAFPVGRMKSDLKHLQENQKPSVKLLSV